jgi:hypothetical protein
MTKYKQLPNRLKIAVKCVIETQRESGVTLSNQQAIAIIENMTEQERSEFPEIAYGFTREEIEKARATLPSGDIATDGAIAGYLLKVEQINEENALRLRMLAKNIVPTKPSRRERRKSERKRI